MKEGIVKNLHIVYNGVFTPELISDLSIEGLDQYSKTVMCIARNSPQKRFETYIAVAKLLPQYAFVWIGADKIYNDLPDNLFCLQGMPNAKKYIQLADIFVLPTNYEGVPIVIIDALSYKKPVISSDVGGISEIVLNDENGYVIDNDDDNFSQKIKYVLENKNIYSKFSDKSNEIFQNNLTVNEMVKQYLRIYELNIS
jgi:glycosyltransferase involved in cell wall biosynthesis